MEENKPLLSETREFSEKDLVEEYRKKSIEHQIFGKWLENGDQQIMQLEVSLDLMDHVINTNNSKIKQLEEIFNSKEINIEKRIKKIREKYSDLDLLTKAKTIIEESTTELKETPEGKYVQTTVLTNTTEDLLIEYMNLITTAPELIEKKINETKTLEQSKITKTKQEKNQEKLKERINQIKTILEKTGKKIEELLDLYPDTRGKTEKTADKIDLK